MPTTHIHEILVDRVELARRLGVSRATVERWSRARYIPSYTFGHRCVRYDIQEVKSALLKFQRPALRRLPRGNYQPRRKPTTTRFEAQQMELRFAPEDPSQLMLPLG